PSGTRAMLQEERLRPQRARSRDGGKDSPPPGALLLREVGLPGTATASYEDIIVTLPRIVLSGICPELEGLRWESDRRLCIGRMGPEVDIVLADASISRRHAVVLSTPRGWVVRDLGSRTGTLLNGELVQGRERLLRNKDELQCGKLV